MAEERYELAIVGAGPGGYVAAVRAAQLGMKVICIDKAESLGGTCLNVGCIPSKALLHSTEVLERVDVDGKNLGIICSSLQVDFFSMMERKNAIVKGLCEGVAGLFKKHGVSYKQGEGIFIDPNHLKVNESIIFSDNIILATGSEPIELQALPFDKSNVLSSTEVLSLTKVPNSLVVIGGGAIGVELASVYQRLGSKVTLIEMMDRLCPSMEKILSRHLLQNLRKKGISVLLSAKVISGIDQREEIILTIEQEGKVQNLSGEKVLVAIGRRPFTQGLDLGAVGIEIDRKGFIPVDSFFRTKHPHIFAIGDLIDGPMLAHKASEEGIAVVEWLNGNRHPLNYLAIPNVVYTNPELAAVGLSEEEAVAAGLSVAIGLAYFKGNPRARCNGETEGVVKIIGDRQTGRLLGMHIIGSQASELISVGMLAMQTGALVADLAQAPQAHPTLGEAIKEAAFEALRA
ncbi:MAG: dihydrolipoyl dehydrogenase [Candidatus Protochlamydia sp.]|nr:dihydrolipoyl dehydrogenase [Candidatus Protochlamydia sp.]